MAYSVVWGLFSCACICSLPVVGGGCGCVIGLGIKMFMRANTLSGSRSTPCERPPPVVVVVARAASLKGFFFGCGLCVVGCL